MLWNSYSKKKDTKNYTDFVISTAWGVYLFQKNKDWNIFLEHFNYRGLSKTAESIRGQWHECFFVLKNYFKFAQCGLEKKKNIDNVIRIGNIINSIAFFNLFADDYILTNSIMSISEEKSDPSFDQIKMQFVQTQRKHCILYAIALNPIEIGCEAFLCIMDFCLFPLQIDRNEMTNIYRKSRLLRLNEKNTV